MRIRLATVLPTLLLSSCHMLTPSGTDRVAVAGFDTSYRERHWSIECRRDYPMSLGAGELLSASGVAVTLDAAGSPAFSIRHAVVVSEDQGVYVGGIAEAGDADPDGSGYSLRLGGTLMAFGALALEFCDRDLLERRLVALGGHIPLGKGGVVSPSVWWADLDRCIAENADKSGWRVELDIFSRAALGRSERSTSLRGAYDSTDGGELAVYHATARLTVLLGYRWMRWGDGIRGSIGLCF